MHPSRIFCSALLLFVSQFHAYSAEGKAAPAKARKARSASAEATSTGPAGKPHVYKTVGGKALEMEIYFPPNHDAATAKVPGLILFHGGSWSGGNLNQFRTAGDYFARRGLVTATVNYRMLNRDEAAKLLPGETKKRVCITDAKSAIRWFKQHARELGLDPARIIAGGGSAGGHIAVLATSNPGLDDPADPKDIDTSVVAYLLFNPAFAPDDKQDAEVDVLRQIKPTVAPAIVFFGTNDPWKVGWDKLHQQLKSAGNTTIDLRIAEGEKHSFFNRGPWQTVTLIAADRFLVQQGLLTGEPTLSAPASGQKLTRP